MRTAVVITYNCCHQINAKKLEIIYKNPRQTGDASICSRQQNSIRR